MNRLGLIDDDVDDDDEVAAAAAVVKEESNDDAVVVGTVLVGFGRLLLNNTDDCGAVVPSNSCISWGVKCG